MNVLKKLPVKCEEIWLFDKPMFYIIMNQENVNWIYVAYSHIMWLS
jgi:hypothetical protein